MNVKKNQMKKQKNKKDLFLIILGLVLILYVISLFIPLLWAAITSLKDKWDYRRNVYGLPTKWMFINYPIVLKNFNVRVVNEQGLHIVGMARMYLNSFLYACGCAFFATLTPCVTAYVTSKYNFSFSKVVYSTVILCMILPIVGALPSEVQMAQNFGFYDKMWGIWLMKASFLGMYYLVFHATFKGISPALSEAAEVDGASHLAIFLRLMLPLVRNTFFTIFMLKFIEYWNDYQMPLIYIPSHPTIAFGMYIFAFSKTTELSAVPYRMAGAMLLVFPIIIIFLIFHKKLIGNVSLGGVKE